MLGEGSFAGKGIYDVDAFEAALAGPRAREHAAVARSVRRHLRARRARLRRGSRRGIPVALRRRLDAPASLGARRLAAAAVDLRPPRRRRRRRTAAATAACRSSACGRCSTTCAARCRRPRASLALLVGLDAAAERRRRRGARSSCSRWRCRRCCRCSPRILPRRSTVTLRSHLRALRLDFGARAGADRAAHRRMLGYQAWLMARCHRPHDVAHAASAAGTCSNGFRPTCSSSSRADFGSFYARMGRGVVLALVSPPSSPRRSTAADCPASRCRSCCCGCARAADRLAHQPHAARGRQIRPVARRAARAAPDRAPHLALLRDVRHGGGQPPAARQLPGRSARRGGAPHLAHQHRPLSTVDRRGARLRLVRTARRARSHRGDARHHGAHAEIPRPPLQLVRHARSAAARAALRLLGRLGQPRRAPDHARRRVPRMAEESGAAGIGRSTALPTRSISRARRCASSSSRPGRPSRAACSKPRSPISSRACARRTGPLDPQIDALARRRGTRLDAGRHGAHARERERTRSAAADLVYWVEATRRTIDSWRSDLLARDPAGFIVEHLESLANIALELAAAMEFGFLLDTQRKLLSIGYRATDGTLDRQLLRPAGLRSAPREFHRDRQGRHPGAPLVPARPHGHADRRRRRARFLVGLDVRVPDAGPRAARAGR